MMSSSQVGAVAVMSVLAVVVSILVPAATTVAADDPPATMMNGATVEADWSYRIEPDLGVVAVDVEFRVTNTKPNRDLGRGRYEYYFFEQFPAAIHADAINLQLSVDGSPTTSDEPIVGGLVAVHGVHLGRELRYGRTATVTASYQLAGGAPRSNETFSRANQAFASFFAYAAGDPGLTSVSVLIPESWEVDRDLLPDGLTESAGFGHRVFRDDALDDPLTWAEWFIATNDDELVETSVEIGDAEFVVRSWPDDDAWATLISDQLRVAVPELERLVGQPWPTDRTTFTESSVVYFYGYDGFHDVIHDEIVMGDFVDPRTVLHELAHAWFNRDTIRNRWISEGLTDAVALRAQEQLQLESNIPPPVEGDGTVEPAESIEPFEPFPLNEWRFANLGFDEAETFGYQNSQEVMTAIIDELDDDDLTALLSAVATSRRPYSDVDERGTHAVDWRAFLDLVEELSRDTPIEDLYESRVVDDAAPLDERAATLERFDELAARGGDWRPPETVRSAMSTWAFDRADERIDRAHEVLDLRDELAGILDDVGLAVPGRLGVDFYDATDLDDVDGALSDGVTVATRLVASHTELTDTLESIGQTPPTLAQVDFDDDAGELADWLDDLVDPAAELAEVEQHLATLPASITVPSLDDGAFLDDPDGTVEVRSELRQTADDLHEAVESNTDHGGIVVWVGRLGTSVDDDLDAATDALATGDTETADEYISAATDAIDDLEQDGQQRLIVAGGVILVLVLAGVVLLRRRSARRTDPVTDAALDDETEHASAPDDPDVPHESSNDESPDATHDAPTA